MFGLLEFDELGDPACYSTHESSMGCRAYPPEVRRRPPETWSSPATRSPTSLATWA